MAWLKDKFCNPSTIVLVVVVNYNFGSTHGQDCGSQWRRHGAEFEGGRKKISRTKISEWRFFGKISSFTAKISDDLFHWPGFSDFPLDFPYPLRRIWPFPHKNNHYFRKEFLYDTVFTLFVLSRASDNTTSQNIGGTDAWAVPHLTFGGTVPPAPLGLRPWWLLTQYTNMQQENLISINRNIQVLFCGFGYLLYSPLVELRLGIAASRLYVPNPSPCVWRMRGLRIALWSRPTSGSLLFLLNPGSSWSSSLWFLLRDFVFTISRL